jgi:hypothetical protein
VIHDEPGDEGFAHLFKVWLYRILLLVAGLVGLMGWGRDVYEIAVYHFEGRPAQLERAPNATPGPPIVLNSGVNREFGVRFQTAPNEWAVYERYVPEAIVERLMAGKQVAIVYLPDNPRAFNYQEEELPRGWGWLATGVVGMVLFVLSLRVR